MKFWTFEQTNARQEVGNAKICSPSDYLYETYFATEEKNNIIMKSTFHHSIYNISRRIQTKVMRHIHKRSITYVGTNLFILKQKVNISN